MFVLSRKFMWGSLWGRPMALTVTQIKGLLPGRHADGRGLYLYVQKSGARSWVLLKQFRGRHGIDREPKPSMEKQ